MLTRLVVVGALLFTPLPSFAQQDTLADIRQQLTALFVEVQRLRRELSTTGGVATNISGTSTLDRLNAIEAELQRLTANAEQMEFRINQITTDANNRIGDLNFRLCELEADCDIGQLDETPLGGIDPQPVATQPTPALDAGPDLAVGERADFDLAQAAVDQGDFQGAATRLGDFLTAYPGSPLTAQAHFLRGGALEGLGQTTDAARAYLEAFSTNAAGPVAPQALFRLGASLGRIGQTQDACLTLAEVNVRFPGDPAVISAQTEMQALGCQ